MIPVALTFSGIYSYQNEQHIDFTRLTEAQLFGIFGPVGSGKSTILEAISFALFGETERLNRRDNRYYNMMNLKSRKLLIRFDFRAGQGLQEYYRFEISGKRHQKDFDKVQPFERRQLQNKKGRWTPVETTAEEIIGLSYENFRRTIIIPQGKFQEFLQLGDSDRTRMMKEIFHLERFELFHKTRQLEAENRAKYERLAGQLQEVGEIEVEHLAEREKQAENLEKGLKKLSKTLQRKEEQEKEKRRLKELFVKMAACETQLAKLNGEEAAYEERQKQLNAYRDCLLNFNDLLSRQQENQRKIRETESSLVEKRERHTSLVNEQTELKTQFQGLKAAYQQRDIMKQKAAELETLLRIRELKHEMTALTEHINHQNTDLEKLDQRLASIKTANKGTAGRLKELRKELVEFDHLADIRNWYVVNNHLCERVRERREELQQLEQAVDDLRQQKMRLFPGERLDDWGIPGQTDLTANTFPAILEQTRTNLLSRIEALSRTIRKYQMDEHLQHLAGNLKEGEPCPVCGSTEHPAIYKNAAVSRQLQQQIAEKETTEQLEKSLSEALLNFRTLSAQLAEREKQHRECLERLKSEQKKHRDHQAQFHWENFDPGDETPLEQAARKVERLRLENEAHQAEKEKLESALEEAQKNRESLLKKLSAIESEYSEKSARCRTLQDQLERVDARDYRQFDEDMLHREIEQLRAQFHQLEQQFQEAEEANNRLKEHINILAGEINAAEKHLAEHQKTHQALQQTLQKRLSGSPYNDLEEVLAILNLGLDVEAETQQIEAFKQQRHTLRQQLQQMQRETEGHTFAERRYEKLLDELAHLRDEIEQKNRQLGGLQAEMKKLKQDLETRQRLEQEGAELEKRADNIRILKGMFKGSGFVNYVSAIFLQDLCQAANQRFHRLTRRQLQLEVTENNDFQVRDFLNDGRLRSVKTLSGGQTFQAALSLALALADHIQQRSGVEQNFFFLDEGFGTLDRESLQTVFDTLKSLRKERRIVGIISHVEELQQEIDVYLKIRNEEENGSIVYPSWE